ncbi:ParB/RepB/Spo0J family partition protein [Oscillochloris sp. ZM17-4]|uniref:ParB/RepB/Spo0J family partition protein n=1 Tax=Oscillochloris sp. ZM17-4 TaxID=2866714 RepID=UPI001C73D1C4|nr:ParB/RepB/Spo0J family partition protein [Oscillochloris sp. ZM17-4]MBX0330441.1 ParB/RepB/Spo0J family partition protein [Oscillochloris sp. ZM17-4]
MSRRRGLGSGLDALIPSGMAQGAQTVRLAQIDSIHENRSQPRTRFDEQALDDLAASIREHGVIQPLIVSEDGAGGFELIAGERRWRAARRAGLSEIPVLVKSATPQQLLELALVENVQRADLNPLEEGIAFQTLKDEFGLTDEDVARRVGKSRVAIVNARRLIKLIAPARQALLDGAISAGHGRALLRFDDAEAQSAALDLIIRRDLSVREAERVGEISLQATLAPAARQALLSGTINPAQAQALLRIDDAIQQARVLDSALSQGLGARETERLCGLVAEGASLESALSQVRDRGAVLGGSASSKRDVARPAAADPREPRALSPEDAEAQRLFEELLQTPAQLIRTGNTVRLTITLYSDEQLQGLYERLGGAE